MVDDALHDQHARDTKALLACLHTLRESLNRCHELERQVTELQKLSSEQAETIRRLRSGDV